MQNDVFNYVNRISAVKTFKGVDKNGFSSLVFIFREKPNFELKTTKISTRILEVSPNEFRLFLSLLDDDNVSTEIFDILSEDLLSIIEKAKTELEVQEILSTRFQYWSELFKRKREKLDEKWIQGYVGELWYLYEILIKKVGVEEAIKSWTGPEKANQDFITKDKIFELKTRSSLSPTIKISNENQLDTNMYLVVIDTEKSSPIFKESYTLSILINKIRSKIDSPELMIYFNKKLLEIDLYSIEELKLYEKFAYIIKTHTYYKIEEKFPIIAHDNVPEGIVRYQYDLMVKTIADFIIKEENVWN